MANRFVGARYAQKKEIRKRWSGDPPAGDGKPGERNNHWIRLKPLRYRSSHPSLLRALGGHGSHSPPILNNETPILGIKTSYQCTIPDVSSRFLPLLFFFSFFFFFFFSSFPHTALYIVSLILLCSSFLIYPVIISSSRWLCGVGV